MNTRICKLDKKNAEQITDEAAEIIQNGGLVVFPTETVYGIGGDAMNEESASKIYLAKGRPSDNPLIVHIDSMDMLSMVAENFNDKAKKIAKAFWPGPLTLITDKKTTVPYKTTGGLDTVAIRMPENETARKIIKKSGTPIAAPSANISGRPSITSAEFLTNEFDGKVDMIILGDDSKIGIESTVVNTISERITVLRPGYITVSDIEKLMGEKVEVHATAVSKGDKVISPGMKYTHYSPNCKLYIVQGTDAEKISKIQRGLEEDKNRGIKSIAVAGKNMGEFFTEFISFGDSYEDMAKNMFKIFRKLDEQGYRKAYVTALEPLGIGLSVMDRLEKAAAHREI